MNRVAKYAIGGAMNELLTASEMRAIEGAAIESGDVSGLTLMERAGRGVVDAVFDTWPELAATSHRAVVLCGPGNNGGDGFVIARLLHEWGWEVDVFLLGDPSKLPPDAKTNHDLWSKLGDVAPLCDASLEAYADSHPDAVLAIDALFGTGLTRPLDNLFSVQMELNSWRSDRSAPKVVAVDIPSGLCADSGRYLGFQDENPFDCAIMANLTVSFHRAKRGHYLAEGPTACGTVVVADIGLSSAAGIAMVAPDLRMRHLLSKGRGHKFSHGHALVLTGGIGRTGAARLAARAALRAGAGLVTLGTPPSAQMEVASQITALMMMRIEDSAGLRDALQDQRMNVLCLGPGLGLSRVRDLVPPSLADPGRAVVLDADALTAFSDRSAELFDMLHPNVVLTPHGGEFARLFPDIHARLSAAPTSGPAYSRLDAVRDAAARAGCTVLFKGPDTVIARADGQCAVHAAVYENAAPWLATAGSGDVLAGLITGLLARGLTAFDAAVIAAWLHAAAARSFGPGLISEDLTEQIPKVYSQLEL